jgi:hypothetical protein
MTPHSLPIVAVLALAAGAQGVKPNPVKPAFEQIPVERDASLVAKINESITRGEAWLVNVQGKSGSFQSEERGARLGYTELALYALASGALSFPDVEPKAPAAPKGVKPVKPDPAEEHARALREAIERGLAFVKENPFRETYALSLVLLTLDAHTTPKWERERYAKLTEPERLRYRFPRRLTDAERLWIEQSADELLTHRFKGLFSYSKNPGSGDVSNTQFALLGLRAAARCGYEVPPRMWLEALEYFVKYQDKEGPPGEFPVLRSQPTPGKPLEIVSVKAQERCWGYSFRDGGGFDPKKGKRPKPKDVPIAGFSAGASGTHAAIGIASIILARDELARSLDRKPDANLSTAQRLMEPDLDRAVRDGIAWLVGHWTLEEDPGGGFPFYYLYSVERVGALLNDRFVGGKDWYREGAEILLRRQLKEGAWPSDTGEVNGVGSPDVVTTSFALLFLRRATAPSVFTPNLTGK